MADKAPKGKLDALTGLRFLAAALILAHHARVFRIDVPPYAFDHGVSLFFVLSGFILAYVYPKLEGREDIQRFLALRVARIWPAHVATLFLVALLVVPIFGAKFFANLFMVQAWVPSAPYYFGYNAVSWSISTEFFFYLAFPLLIWKWNRTFWWKWTFAGLLIALLCVLGWKLNLPTYTPQDVVTLHGILYVNPLARVFEFVTGMVAYSAFAWLQPTVARISGSYPRSTFIAATLVEIGVLGLVIYSLMYAPVLSYVISHFNARILREWLGHTNNVAIFPLLIIVLAIGAGMVSRLLSTRTAILLGEISFSVYLFHQIIYNAYARTWLPPGIAPDYWGLVFCLSVTLLLSLLLWSGVEVPCRNWARDRMQRSSNTVPSPIVIDPVKV